MPKEIWKEAGETAFKCMNRVSAGKSKGDSVETNLPCFINIGIAYFIFLFPAKFKKDDFVITPGIIKKGRLAGVCINNLKMTSYLAYLL